MAYDREEEHKKDWNKKLPIFTEYQKSLSKSKLKKYRFVVDIANYKEERLKINHINTGSGFETARIEFRGDIVAYVYPMFDNSWREEKPKIKYLYFDFRWREILSRINYARENKGLPEIEFEREYQTLQDCIDEIEVIRKEIAKFFT